MLKTNNVSQVPFIKILKKTSTNIDQAKVVIKVFCTLSNIRLSETEITTLAYFIIYGLTEKTKEMVIKSKLLTFNSLKNTMTKYRKCGIVYKKENSEDELTNELKFGPSSSLGVFIKVDNS